MSSPKSWKMWTLADLAQLYSLCCDGEKLSDAARVMGRTEQSVRTAVRRRMGKWRQELLNGRHPDPDTEINVLAMLGNGLSQRQAGELLGKDHRTVGRVAARLVRKGLLRREGGRTASVRFVPVE